VRGGGAGSISAHSALLLYDGTCGFCARSVQFVLRHEGPSRALRFASLDGPTGRALHARHPELASVDSLIWFVPADSRRDECILIRSDAVLTVATYLGGVWRVLGALGRLIPRFVRDAAYDWVARRRYRLVPRSCPVPKPEERKRFVDLDSAA
jgi:predicted DCC family thiol-disulfide oxidoreductase YuxK